jgi:hypothetical protein
MIDREVEQRAAELKRWNTLPDGSQDLSVDSLHNLIEATKDYVMSAEEKEEQRRSFAHGNVALHNPAVTREVIDRAAEKIKASLASASAEVASWSPGKEAGAKATFDPQHLADYYERPTPHVEMNKSLDRLEGHVIAADLETQSLRKLVEAADYLQHCRRRQDQYLYYGLDNAKLSVDRASDHYDYLRGQVKL